MKSILTVLSLFTCIFTHAQIINTYAGNGVYGYSGDGMPATAARLASQNGIWGDHAGNLFIADEINNRVRMVSTSGIITTVAGTGTPGYSGDGGPATAAALNHPMAVALDATGNVYIADMGNNCIRKIAMSGGVLGNIITIAGNGTAGYTGDNGAATAATLNAPQSVFVDNSGNVLVGDDYNHCIRKVSSSTGIITTFAGTGTAGFLCDGYTATATMFNYPNGVYADASGNVYIADALNNRVRKVNTAGIVSTVAGTGTPGYAGDGGAATAARLKNPRYVFVDLSGNLYISDADNEVIRKVDAVNHVITTYAGSNISGYSGDGGPATAAKLYEPEGIFVDNYGHMFIGDGGNNRVRVVNDAAFTTGAGNVNVQPALLVYPNPAGNEINITSLGQPLGCITITDMTGAIVYNGEAKGLHTTVNISSLAAGIYVIQVSCQVCRFVKQ